MDINDLKTEAEKLVKKITGNKDLLAKFKKDPLATVKSLVGKFPEDQLGALVNAVKTKINVDSVKDKISGLFGK